MAGDSFDDGDTEADGDGDGDGGDKGGGGGSTRPLVFVGRYSVKNFFLAHFDLLQVMSILLHALGPEAAREAQLVFVPPDKANHGWWGPHKLLWASLPSRRASPLASKRS